MKLLKLLYVCSNNVWTNAWIVWYWCHEWISCFLYAKYLIKIVFCYDTFPKYAIKNFSIHFFNFPPLLYGDEKIMFSCYTRIKHKLAMYLVKNRKQTKKKIHAMIDFHKINSSSRCKIDWLTAISFSKPKWEGMCLLLKIKSFISKKSSQLQETFILCNW